MRYRLRTLLIASTIGPPLLALHWAVPQLTAISVVALVCAAIADALFPMPN